MPLKVGDRVPNATFRIKTSDGIKPKTSDEVFKGKKVALFGVPGAFAPTCSNIHMPSLVKNVGNFKSKGVDTVAVVAVNDAFVMDAWKTASKADGVEFLADGNGEFAKSIDLTLDAAFNGLGTRVRRFSALVDDGVVKLINVEEMPPGRCEVTSGDALLKQI